MSEASLDFFDRIPERAAEIRVARLHRSWTEERWILNNPATRTSVTFTDESKTLWDSIDGQRTVRDLLATLFEKGGSPVDIEVLLGHLERDAFIRWKDISPAAQDEAARFDKGVRRFLDSLIFTEVSLPALGTFLDRVGRRWGVLVISTVMMLLFCLLGIIACDRLYNLFADGNYTPLRVGGSVLLGLAGLAVWVLILPFIAQLLFGLGIPKLGLRIHEAAIRLRFCLPFLRVRSEDPVSLSPGSFARILLARTATYLGMAGVAVLLTWNREPSLLVDALRQLAVVALLFCFLSLSPLLPSQAYRSLCSYLRVKRLRRLAFQYLGRELAGVFGRARDETVHGRILLAFAAYTCVWTILAAKLASIIFRSELPLLLSEVLFEEGTTTSVIALVALLVAAGGILAFVLGSIIFVVWKIVHWVRLHVYPKKDEQKTLTDIPVIVVLALLVWMLPGRAGWSIAQMAVPLLFALSVFFMVSAAIRLTGSMWSLTLWGMALAGAGFTILSNPIMPPESRGQLIAWMASCALLTVALLVLFLGRSGPFLTAFLLMDMARHPRLAPIWISLILGFLVAVVPGTSSPVLSPTDTTSQPWIPLSLISAALWLNAAFGFRHLMAKVPAVPPGAGRHRAQSDKERLTAAWLDLRTLIRGALVGHFGEGLCSRYERHVGAKIDAEEKPGETKEIAALAMRLNSECRTVFDRVRGLTGHRLLAELVSAALHRIFWMEREVLVQHVSEIASVIGRDEEAAIDARQLIVRLPLFSGLDDDHRMEVASLFRRRHVAEGMTVISQGEPGREFCVIARGTASVEVEDDWGQRRTVAHLADGDYFGEIALLHDVPRTATIVAQTPLDLFILDRQDFRAHLTDVSTLSESIKGSVERVNMLRGISLFRRLPPALVSKVAAWFEPRHVKSGDVIIREGERGAAFYVILKGACQVIRRRDEATEEELARLGTGEYFGEISLILQKPTTATVRALEPTELLRLTEDQFLAIFRESTFFAESVSRVASRRAIDTAKRMST